LSNRRTFVKAAAAKSSNAPVWTTLYFSIAVSGWLVWREVGFSTAALPLMFYGLQLFFNAVWTPLFFDLHRVDLGFWTLCCSGYQSSQRLRFSIQFTWVRH